MSAAISFVRPTGGTTFLPARRIGFGQLAEESSPVKAIEAGVVRAMLTPFVVGLGFVAGMFAGDAVSKGGRDRGMAFIPVAIGAVAGMVGLAYALGSNNATATTMITAATTGFVFGAGGELIR